MGKINPFSLISNGYEIRMTRISKERNPQPSPKKYCYHFDLTIKKEDAILHSARNKSLDADDLEDLKIELNNLAILFMRG